jgi:CRP-like cAMP-binding protein
MDRRKLLSGVSIFSSLGEHELDLLLEVTTTKRLEPKELLFRKGDPGKQLYGILSGRLKVMASGKDGRELVFGLMGPGEVIGEIALMDSNPRSATVVALEPSELLTLHRRELIPFLERQPKMAIHLAGVLAGRLRRLSEHTEDTLFLPLPSRMAKTLLALSSSYGHDDASTVDIPLAQQDLADMVGTTRESVNKQLRAWEDGGIVALKRARVAVLDMQAVRSIAGLAQL